MNDTISDTMTDSVNNTANNTIDRLITGHARFQREIFPHRRERFQQLAEQQQPDVLFITCSDSRIVPDLILQSGPGELFVCRNAGNVVPPYGVTAGEGVAATIEYAVKVLFVGHIIICGHSDCGAARAVFEQRDVRALPSTSQWLAHVQAARDPYAPAASEADPARQLKAFICANVRRQMENLRTHPAVQERLQAAKLQVHGWYYEIGTGAIQVVNAETGEQRPLVG